MRGFVANQKITLSVDEQANAVEIRLGLKRKNKDYSITIIAPLSKALYSSALGKLTPIINGSTRIGSPLVKIRNVAWGQDVPVEEEEPGGACKLWSGLCETCGSQRIEAYCSNKDATLDCITCEITGCTACTP